MINISIALYYPVATSSGRSKSPIPMTTMLAVNKFKSAGVNHSGQRHKNGKISRRTTAENNLMQSRHSSTGQNNA